MHDPKYLPCGLSDLRCERCGNTSDRHVGTHREAAGQAHWCWTCLRTIDNTKTLHELNEERRKQQEAIHR